MPTIALSTFARNRHQASQPYSHFEGSEERLLELVQEGFAKARAGYRDGVVLVPVPPGGFFASTVDVHPGTKLKAYFEARQPVEAPFIQVLAGGTKQQADAVDIVLYRADVLAEDDDRSNDAEWEVISINARVTEAPEPMDPMTMARNFLHLPGGTKGSYTAEEFAESILYWSTRCRVSSV